MRFIAISLLAFYLQGCAIMGWDQKSREERAEKRAREAQFEQLRQEGEAIQREKFLNSLTPFERYQVLEHERMEAQRQQEEAARRKREYWAPARVTNCVNRQNWLGQTVTECQ